jgi:hypothetical protein
MKKLIIVFSMVLLLAGCTTIFEQYTKPQVRPKKHHFYYGGIYLGFPYFYFSSYFYHGLYGYYGGYYQGYPTYLRKGGSVITKKQLKKTSSRVTVRSVQREARKTTVTKSTLSASTKKSKSAVKKK